MQTSRVIVIDILVFEAFVITLFVLHSHLPTQTMTPILKIKNLSVSLDRDKRI